MRLDALFLAGLALPALSLAFPRNKAHLPQLAPRINLDDDALEEMEPSKSLSKRFNLDDMDLEELQPDRPILSKRADDVTLGHSLSLAWSNKATRATLTAAFNATNERVINMDAFSNVVSAVDCTLPELWLDFIDQSSFEAAVASWGWVHEQEDHHFIMIVDSPKCGSTSGWVLYNITDVSYDTESWITYLSAEEISYKSAIRHGHLTIETFTPSNSTLSRRGLHNRASVSKEIELANSYQGKIVDIPLEDVAGTALSLECTECSTAGTANLRLDVDISWFQVKKAALSLTANDVVADVNLALDASVKQSITGTQELWSIQAIGVSIPGIAKLGFGPEVGIGWDATVGGEGTIGWGAKGTMTPVSTATLCFVGCDTSSEGWEVNWEPTTPNVNGTLGVDVDVSTYLTLAAAASLFSLGYEGGVALVAPSFKGSVTGLSITDGGVCGGDEAAVMGIESSIQVGAEAYAYMGVSHIKTDQRWDFFSAYATLLAECTPFEAS